MIYDESTETVVGNLGWVDRGSLWTFSAKSNAESRIEIEGAQYLSLKPGNGGLFRLVHHQSPDRVVTIRHSANPSVELAGIRFDSETARYSGDIALWNQVDPSVIIQTDTGPRLILIDAKRSTARPLDLSWFNNANYDLGYQGLVDCLTFPESGIVVVAVQRSSELVLIDIEANARVGSIMLASRGGNPTLVPLSASEFVATDYDTICVVDAKTRTSRHSAPLQSASGSNTQQFIGDFDIAGTACAVARPFSGDVALVDLRTFKIVGTAPASGQPLAICLLSGSRFLTRDWKTGKPSVGSLPKQDARRQGSWQHLWRNQP